jgi:cytochrome c oxidase subunit 4
MTTRALTLRSSLLTGAALLALWALSWGLSYANLGQWSIVVALVIAAAKAMLVALFFMELLAETSSFNLALVAAVVLVVILLALTVADVATRQTPRFVVAPAHPVAKSLPPAHL